MCRLSWNFVASSSCNSQGLSSPLMGLIYLYLYLNVGVLKICRVFFLSPAKIEYRWVTINCSFISDVKKKNLDGCDSVSSGEYRHKGAKVLSSHGISISTGNTRSRAVSASQKEPTVAAAIHTYVVRSKMVDNMQKTDTKLPRVCCHTTLPVVCCSIFLDRNHTKDI
jgi:hypothetical protein